MSGEGPHEERNATAAITGVRLAEIRRRAEASAEGPFELWERGFRDYDVVPVDARGEPRGDLAGVRGMFMRRENAEFFARARTCSPCSTRSKKSGGGGPGERGRARDATTRSAG